MSTRLIKRFQSVKKKKSKIFCAFLTLGFPNLSVTERLIQEMDREGVDIIELGFPFSDPLADGPTIQYSSQKALEKGVRIEDAFRIVSRLRRKGVEVPIVFFTYLNPVYHYGINRFVLGAKRAGFDALLIPDLPPEEEKELQAVCRRHGLAQVYLVAPTTELSRARAIVRHSRGFIYYVSLRGVTGARQSLPSDIQKHLKTLRRLTPKPVLVGFGVSRPDQARHLARGSTGVIVGSALVERLRRSKGRIAPVMRFVRSMMRAVKDKSGF